MKEHPFFSHEGENAGSAAKLFRYVMRSQRRELAIYLALMLFSAVISMSAPLFARYMTDRLLPDGETASILVIMCSLILGITAGMLINVTVNRTRIRIQSNVSYLVLSAVLGRVMRMSSQEEDKLADRITGLILPFVQAVETLVESGLGVALYVLQCLMVLNVIRICDPENSRVLFLLVGLELLLALLVQRVIFRNTLSGRKAENELATVRRELLDNLEAIRSNAAEEIAYQRFAKAYDENMRIRLKIQSMNQWMSILGTLVSGVGVLLVFLRITVAGMTDLGMVAAMVASFSLLASYLNCLVLAGASMAGCLPHLRLADTVLKTPVESGTEGGAVHELSGAVQLCNVSFSYGADANPVIRNLNLTVAPGEYVGIVGPSGCGKSTLMRLMLGFLTPTEGSISYDGIELSQFDPRALRRQFGVVLQDAAVVTGTVRRNIGLSDDADPELVSAAARSAAIYDEIMEMPMGFETRLSSETEMISGGQRQRIVLARALMHRPKILFLDEATSAMDNVSQKTVKENMDALGITRISIAHRLSTVMDCDRILVMEHGRIVEQGTFQQLLEQNGLFAEMARRNLA